MRKTLLAAFIGASVVALPAFAQVSLGGAGRVGAGVTASPGSTLNGAMRAPGQVGMQAGQDLRRTDRQLRHSTRQASERTRSTLDRHGRADLDTRVNGAADADAHGNRLHANAGVEANAGVDAGAAAARAGSTGRGVGGQVRDSAHTAIDSADRSAGSVGDAVRQTATGSSVGADANVRARADEHGH
jgi:hypothetical protein